MQKRVIVWVGAVLLSLAAGGAMADTSADKKPGKAKPGAACKTADDCDQSAERQVCRASKCERQPVPPPT
jgi:hypothetical protein